MLSRQSHRATPRATEHQPGSNPTGARADGWRTACAAATVPAPQLAHHRAPRAAVRHAPGGVRRPRQVPRMHQRVLRREHGQDLHAPGRARALHDRHRVRPVGRAQRAPVDTHRQSAHVRRRTAAVRVRLAVGVHQPVQHAREAGGVRARARPRARGARGGAAVPRCGGAADRVRPRAAGVGPRVGRHLHRRHGQDRRESQDGQGPVRQDLRARRQGRRRRRGRHARRQAADVEHVRCAPEASGAREQHPALPKQERQGRCVPPDAARVGAQRRRQGRRHVERRRRGRAAEAQARQDGQEGRRRCTDAEAGEAIARSLVQ